MASQMEITVIDWLLLRLKALTSGDKAMFIYMCVYVWLYLRPSSSLDGKAR